MKKQLNTWKSALVTPIEKGYHKAYHLYRFIVAKNLDKYERALDFLVKGVEKHSAHACISLLTLYLYDGVNSTEKPLFEEYEDLLKKAWKYAKNDEKCYVANNISWIYSELIKEYSDKSYGGRFDSIVNECKEKAIKFSLIANEYGNGIRPQRNNSNLANFLKYDIKSSLKRKILDSMYDNFDASAALLFGLLLIQNSGKRVNLSSEAWLLFAYGMKSNDNACALLYGLIYGSHLPGSGFDAKVVKQFFDIFLEEKRPILVPAVAYDTYLQLLNNYDKRFDRTLNEIKRYIYAPN